MKEVLIRLSMNLIKENFPDCDDEQLEGIQYGLEGVYMTFTKVFVIFILAYMLGIFKESLILLCLFNILRITAFGLHASKSWMCWISSILIFLGCPILCLTLKFPLFVLVGISSFCCINFLLYSPADTKKRPLVNSKKRVIYKTLTLLNSLVYLILLFFIDNTFLQNSLVCAMIIQTILIHPMVYKMFRLPYNNYKSYVFSK